MTAFSASRPKDQVERSRLVAIGLAVLLVWSFALRIWFGSAELLPSRFWDERYGLENIQSMLETGRLRPVNGFHPSLSYLPQAGCWQPANCSTESPA